MMLEHILSDSSRDRIASCRKEMPHYHVIERGEKMAVFEHRNETVALRSDDICGCAECREFVDVPFHVRRLFA